MLDDQIKKIKQAILGEEWVTDRPNILAPQYLAKVNDATLNGTVFGLHCHYAGARAPSQWAALDFEQFKSYLTHSCPGDWYFIWSIRDLMEKGLALAYAKYTEDTPTHTLIFPPNVLERIMEYLAEHLPEKYNEFIAVYIDLGTQTAECHFGDIDSYEELLEWVARYSHRGCEVWVFPLGLIDKPEHYVVEAKYPNDKGQVPRNGPY